MRFAPLNLTGAFAVTGSHAAHDQRQHEGGAPHSSQSQDDLYPDRHRKDMVAPTRDGVTRAPEVSGRIRL